MEEGELNVEDLLPLRQPPTLSNPQSLFFGTKVVLKWFSYVLQTHRHALYLVRLNEEHCVTLKSVIISSFELNPPAHFMPFKCNTDLYRKTLRQ